MEIHRSAERETSGIDLAAAAARGEAVRVRQGHYAAPDDWRAAFPEERQVALAHATAASAQQPPVFSHATAAALHGLPLLGRHADRVHTIAGGSGNSSAPVRRHRDRWDGDEDRIDGLRVTSLARTVFDVARSGTRLAAVACADAALRRASVAPGERIADPEKAEALRASLQALADAHGGARGIRTARFAIAFADPRAESPGESVSRVHLHDLGYRNVRIQVPVVARTGRRYDVDFRIGDVLGEFDGRRKYVDRAMRGGRTVDQVVLDEKRREDEIRGATGLRLLRWTAHEIRSLRAFGAFLRAAGLSLAASDQEKRE